MSKQLSEAGEYMSIATDIEFELEELQELVIKVKKRISQVAIWTLWKSRTFYA